MKIKRCFVAIPIYTKAMVDKSAENEKTVAQRKTNCGKLEKLSGRFH